MNLIAVEPVLFLPNVKNICLSCNGTSADA